MIDAHDKFKWEEATIFNVTEMKADGRPHLVANIGFRVYRPTGKKIKEDGKGTYDGWADRYDEYIPIYSPRL